MPVLAIEIEPSPSPLLVTEASPLPQRLAVECYGQAIKREMRYDFPLASAANLGSQRVWLLQARRISTVSFIAAGAVSFDRLDSGEWMLGWMYVHPYERGQGLIDDLWPRFVAAYGQFLVDEPISEAAKVLLARVGHPA